MAKASLTSPLSVSVNTYNSGSQSAFNVFGNGFSVDSVTGVQVTSTTNGVSWSTDSWGVTDSNTITIQGTPSLNLSMKTHDDPIDGDMTVTLNPTSNTNKSTASKIVKYNP